MAGTATGAVGRALPRLEGPEKVRGAARYAVEHAHGDGVLHGWVVQAPAARGRIVAVHAEEARRAAGVVAVLTHEDAPRLHAREDHPELAVLQDDRIAYRGQVVAAVAARTLEQARHAAGLVRLEVDEEPHDVVLRTDHERLCRPDGVNAGFETDTDQGDADAGLAGAAVTVDATYSTPAQANAPMEPHGTLARWRADGTLVLHDANQGAASHRATIAEVLGLDPGALHVLNEHVGGGFGSKGEPHPNVIVAALLARAAGGPLKLAVPRQHMFAYTGYRTPTIQRLRLGAGADGRLTAVVHEAVVQTSTLEAYAEQAAVASRSMYRSDAIRTRHRVAPLDVPTPSWMRAPGECPGMFALESAMDELAVAAGIDPVELRVRNDAPVDPETGEPWTSRGLVACLREGARRFGWETRDPEPGAARRGRKLVGLGVAASAYPTMQSPSQARVRVARDGTYEVAVAASDIGTGARTVLAQLAAEALDVGVEQVRLLLGDSALPEGPVAGGSSGTASWGSAVVGACRRLRERGGREAAYDTTDDLEARDDAARNAYGAQFCEVEVDRDTGEVQVVRHLGVFAAGRILNPMTARSQFVGGMLMGIGMALMERAVFEPRFGDVLGNDLAQYHVPVAADVPDLDAAWIDEDDPQATGIGVKGIGEIGIVGCAAAVANAVFHATGVRFRDLPLTPDRLLDAGVAGR